MKHGFLTAKHTKYANGDSTEFNIRDLSKTTPTKDVVSGPCPEIIDFVEEQSRHSLDVTRFAEVS